MTRKSMGAFGATALALLFSVIPALAHHFLRIAEKFGNVPDSDAGLLQENPRKGMPESVGRRFLSTVRRVSRVC